MPDPQKRSKDPIAFARRYKPNKSLRHTVIGLNVLLSLAIAVLLFQNTQIQFGVWIAALLSTVFFVATTIFVLAANILLYKKVIRKRFQDPLQSSDNIDVLQQQLELCLEFGDVEKADRISRKLLKMSEYPVENAVI